MLDSEKSLFCNLVLVINYFLNWIYQKIILAKVVVLNWYSSMNFFFVKILTIFDIEKWLWKSDFCNFASLSSLSKKVQKIFYCNFCDSASISVIVISFHQIPLTWWNAYRWHYPLINYLTCDTASANLEAKDRVIADLSDQCNGHELSIEKLQSTVKSVSQVKMLKWRILKTTFLLPSLFHKVKMDRK